MFSTLSCFSQLHSLSYSHRLSSSAAGFSIWVPIMLTFRTFLGIYQCLQLTFFQRGFGMSMATIVIFLGCCIACCVYRQQGDLFYYFSVPQEYDRSKAIYPPINAYTPFIVKSEELVTYKAPPDIETPM